MAGVVEEMYLRLTEAEQLALEEIQPGAFPACIFLLDGYVIVR
jgi:hypothetical protein